MQAAISACHCWHELTSDVCHPDAAYFRSEDSFARAQNWVRELQRQGTPNLVMALAGNKADLADKRKVETAEAQAYADENGLFYMETSAKTAANVNELFYEIARKLPRQAPAPAPATLRIDPQAAKKDKKSNCC